MHTGIEPRPWRQCAFAEWISHLEAMDAWDESLQNMRHSEWVIHRKLGEAAGLAHRYIIPARGSGKSMFYWPDHEEEKTTTPVIGSRYTEALIDKDILGWDDPRRLEFIESICENVYREWERRKLMSSYRPITSYSPFSWEWNENTNEYRWRYMMPIYTLDEEEDIKG